MDLRPGSVLLETVLGNRTAYALPVPAGAQAGDCLAFAVRRYGTQTNLLPLPSGMVQVGPGVSLENRSGGEKWRGDFLIVPDYDGTTASFEVKWTGNSEFLVLDLYAVEGVDADDPVSGYQFVATGVGESGTVTVPEYAGTGLTFVHLANTFGFGYTSAPSGYAEVEGEVDHAMMESSGEATGEVAAATFVGQYGPENKKAQLALSLTFRPAAPVEGGGGGTPGLYIRRPAPSLLIGVDGGYVPWKSGGSWDTAEFARRKALGAVLTRFEWAADDLTSNDAFVLKCAEEGIRLHALLAISETAAKYKAFVTAFIKKFGTGGTFWAAHPTLAAFAITSFELGNEPYYNSEGAGKAGERGNGETGEAYAEIVKPALEAVKAESLPGKILVASRTYGTEIRYAKPLYEKIPNLNELIYGFAEHPYYDGHLPNEYKGAAASTITRLEDLRAFLDTKGGKPIWCTEYGQSIVNATNNYERTAVEGEAWQKQAYEEFLAICRTPALGITAWFVYQFIDRQAQGASLDAQKEYGIVKQDGTHKSAWTVVTGAIADAGEGAGEWVPALRQIRVDGEWVTV